MQQTAFHDNLPEKNQTQKYLSQVKSVTLTPVVRLYVGSEHFDNESLSGYSASVTSLTCL